MRKVLVALTLMFCCSIGIARATTYTVTSAPYNADNTGHTDATSAIQHAINDAIAAGSGNTVTLPAGTYLVATGGLSIQNSNNLTFTGHTASDTMLIYSRAQAHGFTIWYNTNLTLENLSADVGKDPGGSGNYDLGIAQGTVTGWNRATSTVTISREAGYPLLNRSDIAGAGTGGLNNGYSNAFWLRDDPKRIDFTGDVPTIYTISAAADGNSATVQLWNGSVPKDIHVGEVYDIYTTPGGLWIDCGYGNSGNTNIQYINFYGGAVNWMGNFGSNAGGTCTFDHLYAGPPPYQNDRGITCLEGWQGGGRGKTVISNSTMERTWDDVWDIGNGTSTIISQNAPNQITVTNSGFQVNDTIQAIDTFDAPYGSVYSPAGTQITQITPSGSNYILTLNNNVTVKNAGKDVLSDITDSGQITLTNDTFNNVTGRRVSPRSGSSLTVTGCTFLDGTPLIPGGFDSGQGPYVSQNITITGCTFDHAAGINCFEECWAASGNYPPGATAASGGHITITNNKFISCANPIIVKNVTGATIANNWFDNCFGSTANLQYDNNAAFNNNSFLHPNEQSSDGSQLGLIYLSSIAGATFSGNIVYSPGQFLQSFIQQGTNNSGFTGTANGIIDIDNPLAFYLSYDSLVMDRPSTGSILDQASWTGGKNQKWQALPTYSNPGLFTLNDSGNGKYVGNGTSTALAANIVEENQAWTSPTSMVPVAEQLWDLNWIDSNNSDLINSYSNYDVNVYGGSSSPGTQLIQYYTGSGYNHNWYTVTPPELVASSQFGVVNLTWSPVPYATSYTVGRSTTAGGPYATIASNLATLSYADSVLAAGAYYYVVTANGVPVSNGVSNEALATSGISYVPVNIASAFNIYGIEPDGWNYQGLGFDGYQYTYSGTLVSKYITANSSIFSLTSPGVPDAISDQGQRIVLPGGICSKLLILGSYLGGGPSSTGTFQPMITYTDGTQVVLSQGMTNWCGAHSQTGETDAATYSYRNASNGTTQNQTNYIHAYSIALDTTRQPAFLDLPSTGNFRIVAMDLVKNNNSSMAVGQSLLVGQYIASPSGTCYLTQQSDGNLVLYNGSGPANKGSAIWGSQYGSTDSYYTILQTDGNLVTYHGTPQNPGAFWWASNTYGNAITTLQVTDSKEVQLLVGSTVVWQKP